MMAVAAVSLGHFFPTPKQLWQAPPYLLIGGFLGGTLVLTSILLAPRIGAVALVSCLLTGQLICSAILDHFGWVGFKVHPISAMRVVGILFLLCGVYLIQRF